VVLDDLDKLGISFSSVFPDFDGLAKELRLRFKLGDARTVTAR
jgi:hypothetical protein